MAGAWHRQFNPLVPPEKLTTLPTASYMYMCIVYICGVLKAIVAAAPGRGTESR